MSMKQRQLLQRLIDNSAIIMEDSEQGMKSFAAYPFADRRRRPIALITQTQLRRFLADGVIEEVTKGYSVVESAARRYIHREPDEAHSAQHRDMDRVDITDEYGRFRSANVNRRTQAPLYLLARRKDKDGQPFLSAPLLEAAEQLARDYARSTFAPSVTQKYDNVGGGKSRGNSRENLSISALDARKRYLDAMDYMGPGLSSVVSALCCEMLTPAHIVQNTGHSRAGMESLLKVGLERLSHFYGTVVGECADQPVPKARRASL